jgi:hypothetical protein
MSRGYSSNKAVVFGVRERKLYRLKGQPMREISCRMVIENREKVAPNVEKFRGS